MNWFRKPDISRYVNYSFSITNILCLWVNKCQERIFHENSCFITRKMYSNVIHVSIFPRPSLHCKGEPYRLSGQLDPLLQTKKNLTTLYIRINEMLWILLSLLYDMIYIGYLFIYYPFKIYQFAQKFPFFIYFIAAKSGREKTLDCKLHWYPKFYKHVILFFNFGKFI